MAHFQERRPTTSFSVIWVSRAERLFELCWMLPRRCWLRRGPWQCKLLGLKIVSPPLCVLLLKTNISFCFRNWKPETCIPYADLFNVFKHTMALKVNHPGTFLSFITFTYLPLNTYDFTPLVNNDFTRSKPRIPIFVRLIKMLIASDLLSDYVVSTWNVRHLTSTGLVISLACVTSTKVL